MSGTATIRFERPTPHPALEYWSVCKVEALFETPFLELVYRAASVHREHFDPQRIQLSTLLSVKTGGCPEDCAYCPQSVHHPNSVAATKLMCGFICKVNIHSPVYLLDNCADFFFN